MEITLLTFVIYCLAAFRLTRLVTTDTIAEGLRNKIWSKWPPTTKIGYLITCNWCTGYWIAILLVIFVFILPQLAFVVSLVLAISAAVGLISAWTER
jgi:hypothetical protein